MAVERQSLSRRYTLTQVSRYQKGNTSLDFKSMNVWQIYRQECGCLVLYARLSNTLLKDEESARDNHVLALNFATYSLIKINFTRRGLSAGYQPRPQVVDRGTTARYGGQLRYI